MIPPKIPDNHPADLYSAVLINFMHVFWDLRKDPQNMSDHSQASFLGSSVTFYWIVWHLFLDCPAPFLGSHAYFLEFKRYLT